MFLKKVDNKGVTLIEAIAVVIIISASLIGLLSTFTYGRFNVERMGLKRKALEILHGKMEYWQNKRRIQPEFEPISASQKELETQEVQLDRIRGIKAKLTAVLSGTKRDGSLSYQDVKVTLVYNNGNFKDSLSLGTKMYLR